jgi:hypothetical protein
MNTALLLTVAGLVVAAALALARTLPAQNVAMILGSLAAVEWALETIWAGPNSLWLGLLFWPATIVLARAGCRWFLRRWRQDWNYGIWLVLLVGAAAALVQFATAFSGFTRVAAAKLAVIRLASTAVCLLSLSPWFISKFPQQPHNHTQ